MASETTASTKPVPNARAREQVDRVSRADLMRLLSIGTTRFDRLVRDGAPVEQTGEGSTTRISVNVAAFVNFMIADAVKKATASEGEGMTYEHAKRKDKSIQAEIREIDLLKLRGELVDINDIQPFVREAFTTVRSRMVAVPSQVQNLTADQSEQLIDAINDALSDLSTGKVELLKDHGPTSAAASDAQH